MPDLSTVLLAIQVIVICYLAYLCADLYKAKKRFYDDIHKEHEEFSENYQRYTEWLKKTMANWDKDKDDQKCKTPN